jgi:hypothetical protein
MKHDNRRGVWNQQQQSHIPCNETKIIAGCLLEQQQVMMKQKIQRAEAERSENYKGNLMVG